MVKRGQGLFMLVMRQLQLGLGQADGNVGCRHTLMRLLQILITTLIFAL